MQIRRFYADNLPAAVRDVRRALGGEAVILSARHLTTEDRRMIINNGQAKVEVTAVREAPAAKAPPLQGARALARSARSAAAPARGIQTKLRGLASAGDARRADPPVANADRKPAEPPSEPVADKPETRATELSEAHRAVPEVDRKPADKPEMARGGGTNGASSGPGNSIDVVLRELRSLRSRLDTIETGVRPGTNGHGAAPSEEGRAKTDSMPMRHKNRDLEAEALQERYGLPQMRPQIDLAPRPCAAAMSRNETEIELASPTTSARPSNASARPLPSAPLPARQFMELLRRQGADVALLRRILERMHFSAPAPERGLSRRERADRARTAARGTFRRFVEVVRDLVPGSPEAADAERGLGVVRSTRPRCIALVGPTGVGKTTTIAKIASYYALEKDLNVAMVTLDTYRIAAAEQLQK